jgi:DNA-binding MarR family transcriptional regulator
MVSGDDVGEATEKLVLASRALVAIAARSIALAEQSVTLTQFRALVILTTRGPITSAELSELLGTAPSSVTRLCDRLLAKGLIGRAEDPTDRRNRLLELTPAGRRLVDDVTDARRSEIRLIVEALSTQDRARLISSLDRFNAAAGEVPESDLVIPMIRQEHVES